MRGCLTENRPGDYQLMAAVNAVHTYAASVSDTDWGQIATLYGQLYPLAPTPIVALNRAVAIAKLDGPAVGLAALEPLALTTYTPWHASRADLLRRLDRRDEARAAYDAAIARHGQRRRTRLARGQTRRAVRVLSIDPERAGETVTCQVLHPACPEQPVPGPLARDDCRAYYHDISRVFRRRVAERRPDVASRTQEAVMGNQDFGRQFARLGEEQWGQHRRGWEGFNAARADRGAAERASTAGATGRSAAVAGGALRARAGARARGPGPARRRTLRDPRRAARGADERLPADQPDLRAQRGRVEAQPRLGLPDPPAARGRGAHHRRRAERAAHLPADGGGPSGTSTRNAGELAAVWAPFGQVQQRRVQQLRVPERRGTDYGSLKPEIGQVMSAVWQIITTGSGRQRREAVEVLVETRRKLYGLLADGDGRRRARPDATRGDEERRLRRCRRG